MERTHETQIRKIDRDNPEYPSRLRELPGMPGELYCLGALPKDDQPSVAVVGARKCSAYGRIQAFSFAREFSRAGIQVISGLELGIDAEGHKGALQGTTPTFAVLGNGVEKCYPASNRGVYRRILEEGGGILSEYPPGTPAMAHHFPARNRIIGGLADAVLVVEAKEKSGSLITANYGLDYGKPIYAVPGPVHEPLSRGCHKLIYDGAGIAYSVEVLLEEWGIRRPKESANTEKNEIVLERDLKLVYSCLDLRPKNPDDIIEETGLSSARINSILTELSVMGLAYEAGIGRFVRMK